MKDNILDEKLKKHYCSKELPADTLALLTRMIDVESRGPIESQSTKPTRGFRLSGISFSELFFIRPFSMSLTALSCMLVVGYLVWTVAVHYAPFPKRLPMAVAKEIALNHRKNLAPEYRVAAVSELNAIMTKLDFKPQAPAIVKRLGLSFNGARYCSIQGHLAVQMKFEDASGTLYTLYQALPAERLSKLKDERLNFEGLRFKVWQERGLLMFLAGPAGDRVF